MSSRVDALEASIQDIINGDIGNNVSMSVPQSPSPAPSAPGMRKSESGTLWNVNTTSKMNFTMEILVSVFAFLMWNDDTWMLKHHQEYTIHLWK